MVNRGFKLNHDNNVHRNGDPKPERVNYNIDNIAQSPRLKLQICDHEFDEMGRETDSEKDEEGEQTKWGRYVELTGKSDVDLRTSVSTPTWAAGASFLTGLKLDLFLWVFLGRVIGRLGCVLWWA